MLETAPPTQQQAIELSAQGIPIPRCGGVARLILAVLEVRQERGLASLKTVARLYGEGVVGGEEMTSPLASSVLKAFARLKKARPKL